LGRSLSVCDTFITPERGRNTLLAQRALSTSPQLQIDQILETCIGALLQRPRRGKENCKAHELGDNYHG